MQQTESTRSNQMGFDPSFELLLFNDFARSLQKKTARAQLNNPGKRRQSTIAIIFRINPRLFRGTDIKSLPQIECPTGEKTIPYININRVLVKYCDQLKFAEGDHLFEMLYIHHAKNEKDPHSGQVSFPGGKLDDGETDFDAVLRETEEQLGIDLKNIKKYIFMGKLPRNFYCYPTEAGPLYISAHVFLQLSLENSVEFKLNKNEVCGAFWVPIREFLDPDLKNRLIMVRDKQVPTSAAESLKGFKGKLFRWGTKGMINTEYFAFRLPNEQPLFGLTFNLTLFTLQMLIENADLLGKLRPGSGFDPKNAYKLIRKGLSVKSVYESVWYTHKRLLANTIYYQMKQKQFEHKIKKENSFIFQASLLLLLLLGLEYILEKRTVVSA